MRARRTPASPSTADADAFSTDLSDFSDLPDSYTDISTDIGTDAPRSSHRAKGPLVLCLCCGESPGSRTDCSHSEVARIDSPSAALRAAAEHLAHAAYEKRALERTVRKLVSAEVLAGAAEISVAPAPSPIAARLAPVCLKCAQEVVSEVLAVAPQGPPLAQRTNRLRVSEHQGFFGFAQPPPEAPAPEAPPEAPTPALGRRKKKSPTIAPKEP